MADYNLSQTAAEVQSDLNKVEGLVDIKSIGDGLTRNAATGTLSVDLSDYETSNSEVDIRYKNTTDLHESDINLGDYLTLESIKYKSNKSDYYQSKLDLNGNKLSFASVYDGDNDGSHHGEFNGSEWVLWNYDSEEGSVPYETTVDSGIITKKYLDNNYQVKTAASGGTDKSLITTGEKYIWNNKQDALTAQTAYSGKGTSAKVPKITTNTLGQVTNIAEVDITYPTVDQTYSASSSNAQSGFAVASAISSKQNLLPTTATSGKVLKSTSTEGTVEWGDAPVTGITSITAGSGLSGGTITSTGTIALDISDYTTSSDIELSSEVMLTGTSGLKLSSNSNKLSWSDGSMNESVIESSSAGMKMFTLDHGASGTDKGPCISLDSSNAELKLYNNIGTASTATYTPSTDASIATKKYVDEAYTAGSGISLTGGAISNTDTYQTTAPTAAATDGRIHIVYLDVEPAAKYDGYIYFINEG